MDQKEIGQLRLKQLGKVNGLFLVLMLILYTINTFYPIKLAHFLFIVGTIAFIQGIWGLFKGNSTKSIFPIVEKVAIYEKEKLGNEWDKQRKVGNITMLFLSLFLIMQAYLHGQNGGGHLFQLDLLLMLIIIFPIIILMNLSMLLHFRRVDRSTSTQDLKGYTWKSILIAVGVGFVFSLLMLILIISYVLSDF